MQHLSVFFSPALRSAAGALSYKKTLNIQNIWKIFFEFLEKENTKKIMKLLSLFLISGNAKITSDKGALSVSHRNTGQSKLPILKPKKTDNVPDFIIMGVNKCGTTAASFFLSNHPELQKAAGEPNFFNLDENYKRGFKWYSQQFPDAQKGLKTYEKTPSYYKSVDAQKRIKSANKHIKLVNVGKSTFFEIFQEIFGKKSDFLIY